MKIRTSLMSLTVVLVAVSACDETAPVGPADTGAPSLSLHGAQERGSTHAGPSVALPFRVAAFTVLESLAPDPRCGEPPRFLNTQVGEGRGTHLGRFQIRFEFCVDATDLLDDGQLTEGESLPYDDGTGIMVAANGDELYLTIQGAVLPSAHPDYDFQFQDPFEFVGGTGRFEGAGGSGTTDSYVDQASDRTDHRFTGALVLERGNPR